MQLNLINWKAFLFLWAIFCYFYYLLCDYLCKWLEDFSRDFIHAFIVRSRLELFISRVYSFFSWTNLMHKLFSRCKGKCFTPSKHNLPCQHLLVQSQQCQHQNNVSNMFKVKNKDKPSQWGLFVCEQISRIALVFPLLPLNK